MRQSGPSPATGTALVPSQSSTATASAMDSVVLDSALVLDSPVVSEFESKITRMLMPSSTDRVPGADRFNVPCHRRPGKAVGYGVFSVRNSVSSRVISAATSSVDLVATPSPFSTP